MTALDRTRLIAQCRRAKQTSFARLFLSQTSKRSAATIGAVKKSPKGLFFFFPFLQPTLFAKRAVACAFRSVSQRVGARGSAGVATPDSDSEKYVAQRVLHFPTLSHTSLPRTPIPSPAPSHRFSRR